MLLNFVLVDLLGKPVSRKLMLWKSFENSKKSITLTKLRPLIFGLMRPLLILFTNINGCKKFKNHRFAQIKTNVSKMPLFWTRKQLELAKLIPRAQSFPKKFKK